ncbi:MAG: 3'(2'),5'-bisphosphate nucleotidase CysQ [Acetobacteraceae bacterium]|nr:3'(2'),5'-bisphosphate nucleotidase CysQ [Acetobacteraceae bacterium]
MPPADAELLTLAADLAARAGETILAVRARGFESSRKADRSIVTDADHAAEALIVAGLRAAAPHIPVVAEEEMAAGHDPGRPDEFWLVDPLDGTREFARGGDDFAVCIGLVRDGRPVLGAVGAPAAREVWAGIVGRGAWKRDGSGSERPIRVRCPPAEGLAVLASRHSANEAQLRPFLARFSVASVANLGSALKFCRVAEGLADLYPRFGRTMEWDTAAPQAVLEAAGGAVRTMADDAPLGYGKPGWENGNFYCTGGS